jgi:protein-disulfide isomerase
MRRPGLFSRPLIVLAGVLLAVAAGAAAAHAEEAAAGFSATQRAEIVAVVRQALKADPSILRDAIGALQADEAAVREAAARTAIGHAGPALSGTPGDPVAGNPDGDVTVVEFYDLRCPYCRRMLPVVADLLRQDHNIRLVYKDIPILGPASVLGARAVLAAQLQGGYQRLHDAIMTGPPTITEDTLQQDAASAGLDWGRLQHDMADPAIQTRLDANLALAGALGIEGTPVYVIGSHMLPGAVDLAELQGAVAAARTR